MTSISVLSLNFQGRGTKRTIHALKHVLKVLKPPFLFPFETQRLEVEVEAEVDVID